MNYSPFQLLQASHIEPVWRYYFCNCYIAALLLHYAGHWDQPIICFLLLCSLIWGLLDEKNYLPFILTNIIVLSVNLPKYPYLANHASLQLFISILVLATTLYVLIGRRPYPWIAIANCLRGTAIVLYFYVGFHKINSAFLDPAVSCATAFHDKILRFIIGSDFTGAYAALPEWFLILSAWAVIILELLACLFLLFPRTWVIGLLFVYPVHFYVTFSNFADFTSMMSAIMLLFVPPLFWNKLDKNSPEYIRSSCDSFTGAYRIYHAIILGLYVPISYLYRELHFNFKETLDVINVGHIIPVLGGIYNTGALILALTVLFLLFSPRSIMLSGRSKDWHLRTSHLVFPALIFAWGFFPYLGLGSVLGLSMFSNLVTEQTLQNHYLIDTRWTKIAHFEEDLVYVDSYMFPPGKDYVASSHFEGDVRHQYLPKIQLQKALKEVRDAGITPIDATVIWRGETIHYQNIHDSELGEEPPYWSKFMNFRVVDGKPPATCRW